MDKHLFKKYLKGQLSHEELKKFFEEIDNIDAETYNNLLHEVWLEFENENYFNASESEELLTNLKNEIQNREISFRAPRPKVLRILPSGNVFRVAAALLAILVTTITFLFLLNNNNLKTFSTQFGETKTLHLPDNSMVKLNANSTIKYVSEWEDKDIREVWLEGEAFFSVKQIGKNQKFIVHTDHLNVEVIGTKFNVNNQGKKTQVVLNEGKVKLNTVKNHPGSIFMDPGELVEYSEIEKKLARQKVNTELYTSWRNNVFVFEDTPIQQIAQRIEEYYGKDVKLADPAIGDMVFTAKVPMGDLDLLLKLVAKSCNVKFTQDENTLMVENKGN